MRLRGILSFLLCLVLLMNSTAVFGFETDQYNLSPVPLGDIGDEVTAYTVEALNTAVDKVNTKIAGLELCLEVSSGNDKCDSREDTLEDLDYLRSEDGIAKAVYKELGAGMIPFTKAGSWLESHEFTAKPARFKTSYKDSIHVTAPFNYLTISPTINMYGSEFGTDKIAHIFQQGFDYYSRYRKALRKGSSEEQAERKAVKWGRMTEKTYFGKLVSAIYSNADLAANFAGLRFYQGLTHEIQIGNETRPAVLIFKDGHWSINEAFDMKSDLLKPYISLHLNEAHNPNKIFNIVGFRSVVRKMVRNHACKQWFERDPDLSREALEATTKSLEDWHGEDYGFSHSKNFVTIANTCFDAGRAQASRERGDAVTRGIVTR